MAGHCATGKNIRVGDEAGSFASASSHTIASYDACAAGYAQSTEPKQGSDDRRPLARFLELLPAGGLVLEIGSGPGWDADWLQGHHVRVRRTDAAPAFVELQRARGATAEVLNVETDDLGEAYSGVFARYVLQHVDRRRLPDVLAKVSRALLDGGSFLLTLREGRSEFIEQGSCGGAYYVAEWTRHELDAILASLGFRECWSTSSDDAEGRWLTILTRKGSG